MMQPTRSRPPARAAATILWQSSRAIEPFDLPQIRIDAGVLDAGLLLGHSSDQRRLEPVVDDLLGAGDFGRLGITERRLPAEQLGLEGAAVIERLNVERAVIPSRHQSDPLSLR
jgi:hypothetical protein